MRSVLDGVSGIDIIYVVSSINCVFVCLCFVTGHGGNFTSKFIKDNLSTILAKNITQLYTQEDDDTTLDIASVSHVLESSFIAADALLAAEPRMRVRSKIKPPPRGQAVESISNTPVEYNFVTIDNSGSTACLCLVGPSVIVTANIGDSRAVLAQWQVLIPILPEYSLWIYRMTINHAWKMN